MELGKLSTSSAAGHIFYFIIDEKSPDEPTASAQRYFYVVSSSASYVEAFNFLCRSICDVYDEDHLRRWHRAHSKVFGALRFDTFRKRILDAPRQRVLKTATSNFADKNPVSRNRHPGMSFTTALTPSLPALFADEASARLALENSDRKRDKRYSQKLQEISAKRQNSSTPQSKSEKIAVLASDRVAAPHSLERHASARQPEQPSSLVVEGLASSRGPNFIRPETTVIAEALPHKIARTSVKEAKGREGTVTTARALPEQLPPQHSPIEPRAMVLQHKLASKNESYELQEDANQRKELLENRNNPIEDVSARQKIPQGLKINPQSCVGHEANVRLLEAKLSETQALYTSEREVHARNSERWEAEVRSLQEKLRLQSHEHGEKLYRIIKDNQVNMDKFNKQLLHKEEELRLMYEDMIQDRDVRLAQLSDELLKAKHRIFVLESEAKGRQNRLKETDLIDRNRSYYQLVEQNAKLQEELSIFRKQLLGSPGAFSHWGLPSVNPAAAPPHTQACPQPYTSAHDTTFVGNRSLSSRGSVSPNGYAEENGTFSSNPQKNIMEIEQKKRGLEEDYHKLLQENKKLEIALSNAESTVLGQQNELQSASNLIELLKGGLDMVKAELPTIKKEFSGVKETTKEKTQLQA